MRILVLSGSPKGIRLSVTHIHAAYLEKQFPNHHYTTVDIGKNIAAIRQEPSRLNDIIQKMKTSDIVIWAFPIYLYFIPSQLKQFIELLYENADPDDFRDIYTTSISTSLMMFDYPAHEYIRAVSEDFKMRYLTGFSFEAAIQKELLQKEVRRSYVLAFSNILRASQAGEPPVIYFPKPAYFHRSFLPTISTTREQPHCDDKTILIVTDDTQPGSNLDKMVRLFISQTRYKCEVIDINAIHMKSGCMGCVKCQYSGKCVIRDDVNDIFADKMVKADCVVFGIPIKDHHFSAAFKAFLDRSLFIAQIPQMERKPITFFVSGPLRHRSIARQFLDIYASNRYMTHLGYITDEYTDDAYLSNLIANHAKKVDFYLANAVTAPRTFFGRAYHLMMRETLAIVTSVKERPYKYYKRHGLFDFPNKSLRYRLQAVFYNIIFGLPFLKTRMQQRTQRMQRGFFSKLLDE